MEQRLLERLENNQEYQKLIRKNQDYCIRRLLLLKYRKKGYEYRESGEIGFHKRS